MRGWAIKICMIILVVAVCFTVLSACKGNVPPNTDNDIRPTTKKVSEAMTEVYTALKASNHTEGVDLFTLTFNGTYSGEKSLTYRFDANFDISATNIDEDKNSEVSFVIAEETGSIIEIFYKEGNLYIDYPPLINKAKFSDINLAPIVKAFYNANQTNGKIDTLASLIPLIGNYIFSDCIFSRENNISYYNFSISFIDMFESLALIMQQADIGIEKEDVLSIFGLSVADIIALQDNGIGAVKISTVSNGGVSTFDKAEFSSSYKVDGVNERKGFVIKDFVLKNGESQVKMPTNLATAYASQSLANLNLEGSIEIDTLASDTTSNFWIKDKINTNFSSQNYIFYYTLKSNMSPSGATVDFVLKSEDTELKFYYANNILYMDLTDLGIGKLLTSAEWLEEALCSLNMLGDKTSLSTNQTIAIFAELLGKKINTNNLSEYSISGNSINRLLKSIGYTSLIKYEDITLSFDTTNNRLQKMTLALDAMGAKMKMSATSPKIGPAVTINEPDWLNGCVDITITNRFTPVVRGTFHANTLAVDDVTVLEKFVESLTGESVAFDATNRNYIDYTAQTNINNKGKLTAIKIDFYGSMDKDYICTLYYNQESENKLYIIYPIVDGINKVTEHTIKTSERYSLFMQAINGNAIGNYDSGLYTMTNNDMSVTLGANREALNGLLSNITNVFSENIFAFIPNDFAIVDIKAKFENKEKEITVNFFGDTYITFTVKDFVLEYYDIGIQDIAVSNRTVSLYQNNNMESSTKVTFGDGSEKTLSLISLGGESLWQYNNKPVINSGTVDVIARVNLLGRVFAKNISVNTAHYTSANIITKVSPYYDKDTKVFTFARYNCNDNPIEVITAFDSATIVTASGSIPNKGVLWYCAGVDIQKEGINTLLATAKFNLTPVVKSFFGDTIDLFESGVYSVVVEGEKATGIRNSDNYLQITAYDGQDPYDPDTYKGAEVELSSGSFLEINAVRFNIDSIRAKSINNINYLKSSLYNVSGTYLIDAIIADSFGKEAVFEVTINVVPRKIEQIEFARYAEGVTYVSYGRIGADRVIGKLIFDPMVITKIHETSIFAYTAICNEGLFLLSSLKWEIVPVNAIDIFEGLSDQISLAIGNEVGGYQSFIVDYEVPATNVTNVALLDGDGQIISHNGVEQKLSVADSCVSFELLGLDPYNYTYPEKVIFYYDEGEHVFEVDWAFGWEVSRLWQLGEDTLYTSAFKKTSLEVHLSISFSKKIIEAFKFVPDEETNNDTITFEKIVDGEICEVQLTYKVLDGQKRFIFASYGAFDSTKAFDYTSLDNYPSFVYIKFLGEEEYRKMDISWDLSIYSDKSQILQNGFSGEIHASIALNQAVEPIYVSIASSYPDEVYVQYDIESELREKKLILSILNADGEIIMISDVRDKTNFPKQLYFGFSPSKGLVSEWFTISEWILTDNNGVNKIEDYYLQQLLAGVAMQDIETNSIVVTARFGDEEVGYIDIPIEVAISPSRITEEMLGGIPLANSSGSGGGNSQYAMDYKITDIGPVLTVNPYIANPLSSSSYPTKITFRLNNDKLITMNISSWDLSLIPSDNLHFGTVEGDYYTIFAVIDVGMGIGAIKLPISLEILPRVIEKVWVDGSSAKNIYIDPYSLQPFGQNIEGNFAFKTVLAKFVADDNIYPMVMKYDISNITLSYTGGSVAYGKTVYIGNEAGGYQPLSNYNIYIKQSLIVQIISDAKVNGEPIGVIYTATEEEGTLEKIFKNLTEEELSAILSHTELKISIGNSLETTKQMLVRKNNGIIEGLVYEWKRDMNNVLYLELWNNSPIYASILGENQIISSGLTNYVQITANLFQNLPDSEKEMAFVAGYTVGDYINSLNIKGLAFENNHIKMKLVRVSDNLELSNNDLLEVEDYLFVLTVIGHCEYGGSLILSLVVTPIEVKYGSDFSIRENNTPRSLTYEKYYNGAKIMLSPYTTIANLSLSIVYDDFVGDPINAGVYEYSVVSNNPNYICNVRGKITILPLAIDTTNSIITVEDTNALVSPNIIIVVSDQVLTASDYSVYYGNSENPQSINLESFAELTNILMFDNGESDTGYVKIVINIENHVVSTFVRAFTVYKAE